MATLIAGITRFLSILYAPEECLESFIYPTKNILKYLSIDILVLFSYLFDLWQLVLLVINPYRFVGILPCLFALLQGSIVQLTTPVKRPFQLLSLLFIWIEPILKCSSHYLVALLAA